MRVTKRNGTLQDVSFDKILERIKAHVYDLSPAVNPAVVAQKVIQGVYDGVKTTELDTLAAETAAYMQTIEPDYDTLASRLVASNLQKETKESFLETLEMLNANTTVIIDPKLIQLVRDHEQEIQSQFVFDRDHTYPYFGLKTLCRGYLMRIKGSIVERPQHMLMRVAIGIHGEDLASAFVTYHDMSQKMYTHASPTMFNAGTTRPQCSSCFLLAMPDDSIEGIYEGLSRCAQISKHAGGIGMHTHCIRAAGTDIAGTQGQSNGLVPMLRVYNATARYVDQGGGKRKGAFAIYLEPWHSDIFEVLELKKNTGPDELRARDLFYGLWIPDLFMKRVEAGLEWSLMCPHECPRLYTTYGKEFEDLYVQYERQGRTKKTIPAQELWNAICESQIESGTPYMCYKDHANHKNNQKNLGTLQGSNLCSEIVEYTSPDEVAVCNLASVGLAMFVNKDGKPTYDHKRLFSTIYQMTLNLNKVIDINYYPVEQARKSNMKHRPIGLGVQGLQDVFFKMRYPFDSAEATALNRDIFETIYFASCTASNDLAKKHGPYESYHGSPMSKGFFQFDLWGVTPQLYNWDELRGSVKKYGMRNSLLVALMPTASTSQILGNVECFEPLSSNIYSRGTLAGTFMVVNRYLVEDLKRVGLWSSKMKDRILANNGSIQDIFEIPQEFRDLYKTVWEIKQRVVIDMSAARAPYVDQSQSLNIHMAKPTFGQLTSMHFHGWRSGLKTGQYYLRTQASADAIKFTVELEDPKKQLKDSFGAMGYHERPTTPTSPPIAVMGAVCEPGCDNCGS